MDSGREISDLPAPPDARSRPRIGVDEWVAHVEDRSARYRGFAGAVRRVLDRIPAALRG